MIDRDSGFSGFYPDYFFLLEMADVCLSQRGAECECVRSHQGCFHAKLLTLRL